MCSTRPQDPGDSGHQGTRVSELSNGQALVPEVRVAPAEAIQLTHLCHGGPTG